MALAAGPDCMYSSWSQSQEPRACGQGVEPGPGLSCCAQALASRAAGGCGPGSWRQAVAQCSVPSPWLYTLVAGLVPDSFLQAMAPPRRGVRAGCCVLTLSMRPKTRAYPLHLPWPALGLCLHPDIFDWACSHRTCTDVEEGGETRLLLADTINLKAQRLEGVAAFASAYG